MAHRAIPRRDLLRTSHKVAMGLQWRMRPKFSSDHALIFGSNISRLYGAQGRDRTTDTAIFSRMLYQLSYLGTALA